MKINKRLEEIIKEKLDDIHPPYQADAWESFQEYRHTKNIPTPSRSKPRMALVVVAASVAAIVIAGVLFYEQKNQNELLAQEIKELRVALDQQQKLEFVEERKALDPMHTQQEPYQISVPNQDFEVRLSNSTLPAEIANSSDKIAALTVSQKEDIWTSALPLSTNLPLSTLSTRSVIVEQSSLRNMPTVAVADLSKWKNTTSKLSIANDEKKDNEVKKWGRLRAGFEKRFAKQYTGNALEVELQLGRRFAIGSGFAWNRFQKKDYRNENEFRRHNKFSPREIKGTLLSPSTFISNITTEGVEKNIPLYLAYRGMLTPKVEYYVKAKTAISLEASQQMQFDFQEMNPHTNRIGQRQVDMAIKSPLISNYSLSVGIEKNWSRVGAQVEAFYMKQNTEQSFFVKEGQYPGISAKIYYQLTQ